MRPIGITLLVIGFVWIVFETQVGFVAYSYTTCIWHIQHLPEGDTVTRKEAGGAMRNFSLALNGMQKTVLMPAALMLGGGLMAAFGKRLQSLAKNPSQANVADETSRGPATR